MCPNLQEYIVEASSKLSTKSEQNPNNLPKTYKMNKHYSDNTHTYKPTTAPKFKKKSVIYTYHAETHIKYVSWSSVLHVWSFDLWWFSPLMEKNSQFLVVFTINGEKALKISLEGNENWMMRGQGKWNRREWGNTFKEKRPHFNFLVNNFILSFN